MHGYEQATYGDRIAGIYDTLHGAWEPTATVNTVAELAGPGGRVLELGVGTGRVALPLARKGLSVTGVDVSEGMLERLREKDPDHLVTAVRGDFVDLPVEGEFDVVFVVNSLLQLTGVDTQARCIKRVAEHMAPGGVFVMEEANPSVYARNGVEVMRMSVDELHLLATQYDSVHQHYLAQHVVISGGRADLHPMSLRLTSTAEFDLMASAAGLRLDERWGDWGRSTHYLKDSRSHISFYRHA